MKARIVFSFLLPLLFALPGHTMGSNPKLDRVEVTEAMRPCQTDTDCIQIDRSGYCDYDAVAKNQEALFEAQKKSQCRKPKTACDCIPDKTKKPACVENRCVLK